MLERETSIDFNSRSGKRIGTAPEQVLREVPSIPEAGNRRTRSL
jgi:hypothetical protein